MSSRRLLIVEDDPDLANGLVDIFEMEGHEVEAVNSGGQALERTESAEIGCVLLDVRLPDLSGLEVLRRIRAESADLPVILMTGYAEPGLGNEATLAGASAVLTKPFPIGEACRLIAGAMSR